MQPSVSRIQHKHYHAQPDAVVPPAVGVAVIRMTVKKLQNK
jgi:hypothetical protein